MYYDAPSKYLGKKMTIPEEMAWCSDFIGASFDYQRKSVGVDQPFMYLTIRHGLVTSETDDEWHVDGFSTKIPHIPEQNYVWVDRYPTEVTAFPMDIPHDFDPLLHNIQCLIQDSMPHDAVVHKLDEEVTYAMDPYIFHRRPKIALGLARTFVRLSMTPIPIDDVNNYTNPAFGVITNGVDGITEFRDQLERYSVAA